MYSAAMSKNHYIKEWRIFRGLSLRKLAARMESAPGEELISFASLGRIERGVQPYSQPILEALGEALGVEPYMLIVMNPESDGDVIDLLKHLRGKDHEKAIQILKALTA